MIDTNYSEPRLDWHVDSIWNIMSLLPVDTNKALLLIESELTKIRARIGKCSLQNRYLDLVKFSQSGPSIEELNEIRLYCLTELGKIVDRDMQSLIDTFTSTYWLDENKTQSIQLHLNAARDFLLLNIPSLVSMESIGYATYGKNFTFEPTDIPPNFTKYWKKLPEEPIWKDMYAMIEYIWLLMVQKQLEELWLMVGVLKRVNTWAFGIMLESAKS